MSGKADRNLIVGLLAFQLEFVDQDELLRCMSQWMHDKKRRLEDILLENGQIDQQRHQLLAQLAQTQCAAPNKAEDATEQTDAELSSGEGVVLPGSEGSGLRHPAEIAAVYTELGKMQDPDVEQSLSLLNDGAAKDAVNKPADLHATMEESSQSQDEAGRFRILRPHAHGGLGQVSIAQDDELKRQVALKEIRSQYADDSSARARFMLEAEVTGGLEHPGVVPVYGMGVRADGRPFYAMRFIRGESLKEAALELHKERPHGTFSAEQSLGLRKLLNRFVNICQTVEYAHSRGILHRDLKPDNILLGPYGETLVVDWGLAKAAGQHSETADAVEPILQPVSGSGVAETEMGSVVGTPAFMSPEQAAGRLNDIGPASDIYSLGATLFFVLSGMTPTEAGESPPDRSIDVGRVLQRVARGDIASVEEINPRFASALWQPIAKICAKSMSLNQEDRYASAAEMAEDIERFLADEAVMAAPDPWLKRVQRWVRRHQTFATTAAALMLVTSVGLVLFSAQLKSKQAELEESNADLVIAKEDAFRAAEEATAQRNAAELASNQALEAKADQIAYANFLVNNILATARPMGQFGGLGINVKVVDALRVAEQEIPKVFLNRPLAEAIACQGVGETWLNLGEYDRAVALLERASQLFLSAGSTEDENYLIALSSLAMAKSQNGDIESGIAMQQQALAGFLKTHGPEDPKTLTARNNLALSYQRAGQFEEAIRLLKLVVAGRNKLQGSQDPITLESRMNLAGVLRMSPTGIGEAKQIYDEILPGLQETLGELHPVTLKAMNNRATLYQELGATDEAIARLTELLEKMETQLGDSHPTTLVTLSNLANVLQEDERLDEALALHQDAFDRSSRFLGENHPITLNAEDLLGSCYDALGNLERASSHYSHVWTLREEVLGESHPDTLSTANNLALAYDRQGDSSLAIPIFEKVLRLRRQSLAVGDPQLNISLNNVAAAYGSNGQFKESGEIYEELLSSLPEDTDPLDRWRIRNNLADTYAQLGDSEGAADLLQGIQEEMLATLGEEETYATPIPANLALARYNLGEYEAARRALLKLCSWQREQSLPESRSTLRGMLVYLALSEIELGLHEEAEASARESFELAQELLAADDWRLFNAQSVLGEALLRQGKVMDAKESLLPAHEGLLSQKAQIPLQLHGQFLGASFDRMIELAQQSESEETVAELRAAREQLLGDN